MVNLNYDALGAATAEFSPSNVIGSGGSCDVFRGVVYGVPVAIKRLTASAGEEDEDGDSDKQFQTELGRLCSISHRHICRLLAVSTSGPHRCLILEFCSGGSLDRRLKGGGGGGGGGGGDGDGVTAEPLGWLPRLRIAAGIAEALAHLHSLTPQVVHRDVKSANILLDDGDGAKLADFGTAREWVGGVTSEIKTHTFVSQVAGTVPYMPPGKSVSKTVSQPRPPNTA
jgi:serine/threonine protein kinase